MKKNKLNFLIVSAFVLALGLACNSGSDNDSQTEKNKGSIETSKKIDSYEIRGLKFAYYKIPGNLSREDLIKTAQEIHEIEKDSQLILIDDDERVAEYIEYVKGISAGTSEGKMPKEWADEHIVANVQKYLNGRWVLCESYGFKEIADLK